MNILLILHWTSWRSGEVFLVSCCRTFKWNCITSSSQQHAAKRPYHNNFPLATFTRNCPKLVPDCPEHQNTMCSLQQFPHLTNQMVRRKYTLLDATHPFLGYCACPTFDPSETLVRPKPQNNSTITTLPERPPSATRRAKASTSTSTPYIYINFSFPPPTHTYEVHKKQTL